MGNKARAGGTAQSSTVRCLRPFRFLCAQTHWDSSPGVMVEFYLLFIFFLIFQNACNEHVSSLTGMVYACKLRREENGGGNTQGEGPSWAVGGPGSPQAAPVGSTCPRPPGSRTPRAQFILPRGITVSRAAQGRRHLRMGKGQVPTRGPSKALGSAPAHPTPPPRARRALPTGLPPTAPAQKLQMAGVQ